MFLSSYCNTLLTFTTIAAGVALSWFPGAWATPEKKEKEKGGLDSPLKTVLNQILTYVDRFACSFLLFV